MHPKYRGMEQLVARQAHNLEVIGSSPVPATKKESLFSDSFLVLFILSEKLPVKSGWIILDFIRSYYLEMDVAIQSDKGADACYLQQYDVRPK